MQIVRLIVPGIPPSGNRYAGRENTWDYREEKQRWTDTVAALARSVHLERPFRQADVTLEYFFPDNRRRDPDNYAGKMLLDGLTRGGVIVDDSFQHISLMLSSDIDREQPRTEITVVEV